MHLQEVTSEIKKMRNILVILLAGRVFLFSICGRNYESTFVSRVKERSLGPSLFFQTNVEDARS